MENVQSLTFLQQLHEDSETDVSEGIVGEVEGLKGGELEFAEGVRQYSISESAFFHDDGFHLLLHTRAQSEEIVDGLIVLDPEGKPAGVLFGVRMVLVSFSHGSDG